jgi:hypothetical protein
MKSSSGRDEQRIPNTIAAAFKAGRHGTPEVVRLAFISRV